MSESISSSAQNFASFANGGVDPRTGLYSFTLNLPMAPANELAGPELDLRLSYNAMGGDDFGFGQGWAPNLSRLSLNHPRILSLATGERFRLGDTGKEPHLPERKLQAFRFWLDDEMHARVIHRDGRIEHLTSPGFGDYLLPTLIEGPNGRWVKLKYALEYGVARLECITDEKDVELLKIEKSGGSLRFCPKRETPEFFFSMNFVDGRLQTLELPKSIGGKWSFDYTNILTYPSISEVTQPLGAIEEIVYAGEHQVPGGRNPLPRVTQHTVKPAWDQPDMKYNYLYGDNSNNFLGYNAITAWPEDGSDPLYSVRDDYTYEVTVEQTVNGNRHTVQRQYNRFHWQVKEQTQQKNSRLTRTSLYTNYANKTFEELPDTCQLQIGTETEWYDTETKERRTENTVSEYDSYGNLLRQEDASGIVTEYSWYDASDQEGCPADPWGFVRHMKSMTRTPGKEDKLQGIEASTNTERTTYTYCALRLLSLSQLPPQATASRSRRKVMQLSDVQEYIVAKKVITYSRVAEDPSRVMDYEYYEDPGKPLSFGRLKCRKQMFNGYTTSQTYSYTLSDEGNLQTILELTASNDNDTASSNGVKTISEVQQSLSSGQTVLTRDPQMVETRSAYDDLNRLSILSISPSPAKREFAYRLWSEGVQARQSHTNAAGVTEYKLLDGLGRAIERQLLPDMNGTEPSVIWQAQHDAFGRLLHETTLDNCGKDRAVVSLTTIYSYDDWGQLQTTQSPDRVQQTSKTSPFGVFGSFTRSWQGLVGGTPAEGITEVLYNRLGQPWERRLLGNDAKNTLRQRTRYYYDGLGQLLREELWFKDSRDIEQTRMTEYCYDGWARLSETLLPNGDRIYQGYADHSTEALVSQVSCAKAAIEDEHPTICLVAERKFDLLDRVTQVTQGGRTTLYTYEGVQPGPTTQTRADGSKLTYTYQPALTTEPSTIISDVQSYSYEFHPITGRLNKAAPIEPDDSIDCHYAHNSLGQLVEEQRENKSYTTTYSHSLGGRRRTRGDSGLSEKSWSYDEFGRLSHGQIDQESAEIEYDELGRVFRQISSGVTHEISYDDLGREYMRKLLLSNAEAELDAGLWTYQFTWNDNGTLAQRITLDGKKNLLRLREDFDYDERNRLKKHRCRGEEEWLPRDHFGLAYIGQEFTLDALDNILSCSTAYADGREGSSTFEYNSDDTCQMCGVTHILANGSTLQESFSYDGQGRLRTRSGGIESSSFEYDSIGRLKMMTIGDEESTYRYDANGSLCTVIRGSHKQHRFYDGYSIDHVINDRAVTRYLATSGAPLAWIDNSGTTTAVLTDSAGSAVGEWRENLLSRSIYSAYGSQHHSEGAPKHSLGYNGELREGSNDAYLLGRGYRLYDAGLMRFTVPDSESPFGAGGLNPYRYAQGNPIMLHDPSGHAAMPIWDASNLPYYIEPEKPQESGGNWLGNIFKAIGWGFIAYEAWSVLSIVVGIVTAPVGGAALAMAGAAALATASVGTGIAAMLDPENDALMWASIGLGVASGFAMSKAGGVAAKTSRRAAGDDWVFAQKPKGPRARLADDLGSPYGDRYVLNPLSEHSEFKPYRFGAKRPRLTEVERTSDVFKRGAEQIADSGIRREASGGIAPMRVTFADDVKQASTSIKNMRSDISNGRTASLENWRRNPRFHVNTSVDEIRGITV